MNAQTPAADHLSIWKVLGRTDPDHTKPFQRAGGFSGTAIRPIYQVQKMTSTFGPCGVGWGYTEPHYQVVEGAEGNVLVYCWLALWYMQDGKRSDLVPGVGGDAVVKKLNSGKLVSDDEAFKKAMTDALGNAMTKIGMAADVHMGRFDDSKYVEGLREEKEASRTQRKPSAQNKRDDVWGKLQADLVDAGSAVSLQRLRNDYAVNVYPSLSDDWREQCEEAFDKRAAELTAENLSETLADSVAVGLGWRPRPAALDGRAAPVAPSVAETVETPAQIQTYRELAKYLNAAKDRADLKARTTKQEYKDEVAKLTSIQVDRLREVYGKRHAALDLAGAL